MTTPVNSWLDQYALPICSDKESPHSYKTPTETFPHFKVRSEHYVTRGHPRKGKKEPSAPPGCNLVGLFLVPAETKIPHICAHALNNKAAGFRVAIVFAVSVKEFAQHIIFLFERAPANDVTLEPEHARKWQALWDQCTVPGNKLMADRMKILPYLSHGANFLMAKVVNNQPGQLAEALECQQFAGQGYVEVHVDIDAYKSASIFTKLAKAAVGMVYPHVAKLTIDLAFMMAALTEDELPERIIGAARLQKIDLNVRTNMLGSTTPSTSGPERRPAASPVATAPSPPRAAPSASSSDSSGVVREVSARKVSSDSPLGKLGQQLSETGQKLSAAVSNGGTLMAEVISDIEQRSRAASKEDVGAGAAPDKNGADSAPARVKKTGVARLSQRFGHWATNDHPQSSPSAASPAATTPAAAATPPTAGKPAAAATPGINAAATPTPPPGKSTPAVPRAAVPTRREPPPGTVPPTAADGERSSMLPERLMNCRCFKCIPA